MRDPMNLVPADIKARYEAEEFVDKSVTAGRALESELKSAFGEEMEVCFVRHDIREEALPANAIAGRWHVRRNNPPPELPTYMPILGINGSYRDPDAMVVAELYDRDLRRPEVRQRMLDETRLDKPHMARQRELEREQRIDVMKEDYRAAKRVRGEGGLKKNFSKKGAPAK